MAIRYQVSTWNSSTAPEARAYRKVTRIDAALGALWDQIYAMCKADAALDTERAQRLHREYVEFCKDCALTGTAVKFGHYFSHDFVLRTDGAGKLDHVRFVAVRER
jgi:hypothetical protein